MPFQIHALSPDTFEHFFDLTEAELSKIGALRVTADSKPGFPCRVSLANAEIGDDLILANYEHLSETSPYRASHAIYVRKDVSQAKPSRDTVPKVLAHRVLSVRGFGNDHLMKEADVVDGVNLGAKLDMMFQNSHIEYVHIHNAKQGCFAAKATR
jgi:hypothetical protein